MGDDKHPYLRKDDRREMIAQAARAVILENGYAALRTLDVAARVLSMSRSCIYTSRTRPLWWRWWPRPRAMPFWICSRPPRTQRGRRGCSCGLRRGSISKACATGPNWLPALHSSYSSPAANPGLPLRSKVSPRVVPALCRDPGHRAGAGRVPRRSGPAGGGAGNDRGVDGLCAARS